MSPLRSMRRAGSRSPRPLRRATRPRALALAALAAAGLVATALAVPGRAQTAAPADSTRTAGADKRDSLPPPRTIEELTSRIDAVLKRTHTPGVSLAIVTRDSVRYVGGIGLADVAANRPATSKTLFRIGSTSKAFVALAALQLEGEGKLDLNAPLRTVLPEFPVQNPWEETDPVLVVDALSHTAGLDDLAMREYANSDPTPLTLQQGLELAPSSRHSRWRPGTRVSYANLGPPLVARVVEKIENDQFDAIAKRRLFDPIGMRTATYLFPDTTQVPLTKLYRADGTSTYPYWHVITRPAGSINASAEDMAAYVRFLLNRGVVDSVAIVPPGAVERMERPARSLGARAGLQTGYGLHLYRETDSLWVWTGHDGGVSGGLTNMSYMPEQGIGYSFSINAGNGQAMQEIQKLVRGYLTRDLTPPARPAAGPMPAEARTQWAGWYLFDSPRNQKLYGIERLMTLSHVAVDDSVLTIHHLLGDATRFVPVSGTLFRPVESPEATLAFVQDSIDGRRVAMADATQILEGGAVRIGTPMALLQIGLLAACALGVLLSLLVMVVGLARRVIRRLRRRRVSGAVAPRPAASRWRLAFVTTLCVMAGFVALLGIADDVQKLGQANAATVGSFVLRCLAVVLAAVGLVLALLPRRESGSAAGGRSVSLVTARVVLVLNAIAVGYLLYWGILGWRTWV